MQNTRLKNGGVGGARPWGSGLVLVLVLALSGCQSDRGDADLKRRVSDLTLKVDSLIDALELQRENDSANIDETSILLKPGAPWTTLKTGVGYLTASVDSFQAHGDGSRVTFRFGNPSGIKLKGMRAYLEWQVESDQGDTQMQLPVLHEFLTDLKPGCMSRITVLLDEYPPSVLKGVRISNVRFEEAVFNPE